jgi:hypothetical protein
MRRVGHVNKLGMTGKLTLWARELATLLASGNRAVDMALEHGITGALDVVVRLDVLLDSLTAVAMMSANALSYLELKRWLTWNRYAL